MIRTLTGAAPLLCVMLFWCTGAVSASSTLQLAANGKSAYQIVLSSGAIPSEALAARELQSYIASMTGVMVPITNDAAPLPASAILLGTSTTNRHIREIGISFPAQIGDEEYFLVTSGKHLVIAGGRPRGVLYGVYSLLEDVLGCRWYTPDCSRTPRRATLELPELNLGSSPAFEYREPFYTEAWDGAWSARNRVNGHSHKLDDLHGGRIGYYPHAHTFDMLVPPEKYGASHPEYFAEVNGKRVTTESQLCMSNPGVTSITAETVIKWSRENPWASLFCVEQNDRGNWCTCEACKAVADAEGAQSGVLMRYLNALGEQLEKANPRAKILTLAYQWTETPPKLTAPRANVRVQLAPINNCFGHAIDNCPRNKASYENLQNWAKLTSNLYIWHYGRDLATYLLPYPDFDELCGSLRAYQRLGVKGVYIEGAYGAVGGSELAEMRSWVLAKLLWNPKRHCWALMTDFANGYYENAAPQIMQYLHRLHDTMTSGTYHLKVYEQPEDAAYLTPALLEQADALFAQAEEAVSSRPEVLKRVQKAHLSVEYARMIKAPNDEDKRRFRAIVKRKLVEFNIGEMREGQSTAEYLKGLPDP